MSIESDILAFSDILNDETKSPTTRILAGDTLRYLLVREGRLADAEPIAQVVKHIGVRAMCDPALSREDADAIYDALERAYITLAPNSLHDYLIALEWNRPAKDRFYQPRMSVMQRVADAITDMVVHDKYDIVEISSPPRVGKLLSDDTPVLTSHGWKNHGDLVVGDRVVAPSGEFVSITHVFPKDYADCLVTFTNGETIQCHENHEWLLYDRSKKVERVVTTKHLLSSRLDSGTPNRRGHRYRFQIPNKVPMIGMEMNLRVDPYALGVWLGDGTTNKPLLCGTREDMDIICANIPYEQTGERTQANTGVNYRVFATEFRKDLQFYDMCQSRNAKPKHIPEIYLIASKQQRLNLLAGLLDTDGCFRRTENRYDFVTVSERLRDDVISLVATFGWRTSVRRIEPSISSSGIVGTKPYYVISFNPTESIPCRLSRKQQTIFSKPRKIAISSIKRVSPKQGNCISVEGGLYCVGRQLITTHNSTIGIFAISWCVGRNCNSPILATGYAEKITKMFYGGLNEIYEDEQYSYRKIFPLLELIDTSAKDLTLDFRDDGGKTRRKYPSLTCRPIDGSLTGATEARQLLYCDDLVRDIEEAMNKDRLDTLYDKYISNAQSRMKEGCKQLIIGTRWSLHDPMSRIAAQYDGNDRCKVICIPALDPETDESNFDYPFGVGFSSDYYRALRSTYETNNDTVTWECVYQQNPIEREGLVFPKEELTFVTSLPDIKKRPPDDIFAFIDVAFGGTDFLCMPIAYQWGDDPPVIMDVVYLRGDYEVTEPVVAGKLIQHNVARALFEANNGGDFYSRDVAEKIKELAPDYHCFISTRLAPNNKSKETRIIQHSPAIKSFSFRDTTIADAQYRQYIQALTTYTLLGKNQNDDAPDASAGLASMMRSNLNATLQVFDRRYI